MEDSVIMNEATKKALEHRKYVLREFIESEREYVRRLQVAMEDYYSHIKSSTSENISPELKNDSLSIFSNLPEIFAFHKNMFLPTLEACDWQEDADAVMQCFLKHSTEFKIYLTYCKNKSASDSVRVEHDKYFTSRQNELGQKLNIEDLLIAPVQKLPKYQLLIKDLLKDTRKASLHPAKIEEALELMMKIPQETNNIICMSLIRGITRARIISHGSLWRQNSLVFSCSTSSWGHGDHYAGGITAYCNIKSEARRVFLFDHRVLVAHPSDADGFFDYQVCLKTLNGRVAEENEDPSLFSFTTENNVTCYFKASNCSSRKEWVKDIRSILNSQTQMKRALVFGKPAASQFVPVRMHSLAAVWSDSDSSVDSMPSSADEEEEEDDWPTQTGFQRINKPVKLLTVPGHGVVERKHPKQKKNQRRAHSMLPTLSLLKENEVDTSKRKSSHIVEQDRPLSCNVESLSQFDQTMQRKSHALSISPRMLRNWVARKYSSQGNRAHIYFPTHTTPSFDKFRSPGSQPHGKPPPHNEILFVALEDLPGVAEQLYSPQPGQVFLAEDVSQVDVWKVKALSGDIAGISIWLQRNCLEEYCAPISLRPLKKEYVILQSLNVGRFSKVKLAKSKATKELHVLKIFQSATSEDQFYRELCIGTRMKHKNLISYYTGLQHQQTKAISMEYINGRQLLDYLVHKAAVTEKLVAHLMKQLVDGLHYLHSHTVFHLDIRPKNIMIDLARDCLKIVDYGAARHSGDVDEVLSRSFETCFDYEFVAPELFQQIAVSSGTDMWGVGLILYLIFYGLTPFYGETNVRIVANITSLQYTFPDSDHPPCSQHAIQLIKDILVLSPSKRPTAEAVRESSWFTQTNLGSNKVKQQQLRRFILQHR